MNVPRPKSPSSHWQKYKVYYLVGSTFLLLLVFILLVNSNHTRETRRINQQLYQLKQQRDLPNSPPPPSREPHDHSKSDGFIYPSAEQRSENWLEENVFQNSVRSEFQTWVNSVKYLPRYRIGGLQEPEQHALFYGPPGSGKSFLAQKFAENEALAYSFCKFGTEIFSGSSQVKVNQKMDEAKQALKRYGNAKPVVIVVDEIDSVGIKNPTLSLSSNQEVNALLTMIDDIKQENLNIIVIGITNYPDVLDPALKRAGRLGRQIEVPYLTKEEITKMVKYLEKDMKRERLGAYKYEGNKSKWDKDKDKDKEVEWITSFWSEVLQTTLSAFEKCKQAGIGISYTDLELSVKGALARKVSKNSKKITPQGSDFVEEVVKKMNDKLKEKPKKPEWPPSPQPVPVPLPDKN